MALSSFGEFLFMASINSWRVPRSRYLSFRNRKKSQGSKSGECGGWAMIFLPCLAKNPVTIRLECDGVLSPSGGDALHTHNMNHNVLSRSIRDVESLCYLSNANTTIFEHNFLYFFDVIVVNRGGWTTRMMQVFCDLTECCMPLKYLRSRYSRFSKTLLQHFQWFRSHNFIGNTKFPANSLFNFFSIVKIARQIFLVVNQWLLNTH